MSSPSIAPLVQAFFVEHLLRHKGASPQTVASYRDAFRLLFHFLRATQGVEPSALTLDDLDAPSLLAFLDHLESVRGNSTRSRNARLAALRSFFRFTAMREPARLDLVSRVLAIPSKRSHKRMVGFLSRDEMDSILAVPDRETWAGRRDHALFLILYNSGARASEICSLTRSQVRLGSTASVQLHGKGRKERVVPLWRKTARVIATWFAELHEAAHPFAFPNARGARLTRHGLHHLLRQAVKRAIPACPSLTGRKISPHVVRHTTAMHLLQAGVDATVIAMWLGHESLETTHGYIEADLAMKERALGTLTPLGQPLRRFKADDALMRFLVGL